MRKSIGSRRIVLVGASILAATSLAQVQLNFTVPQNCSDDLSWTANNRGQPACLVAAYLCDACRLSESSMTQEADCSIPNLTPGGQFYVNHNTPNECDCNSVVYSLISACSLCQGAAVLPWTSWIEDCKNSFLEQFPASIPSNVSVPAWAYLDVASSNTFNASIAQSFAETAHLSDSSAAPGPTSSAASSDSSPSSSPPSSSSSDASAQLTSTLPSPATDSTPPTTTSISLDPASGQTLGSLPTISASQTSNNTSTSSETKKLVGPIVGGVVGGLAGVAAIAVLAFVWYHNHGPGRGKEQYDGRASWLSGSVPGVGASGPGALASWGNGSKIYDPNDPSTFPPLIDPNTGYTQPPTPSQPNLSPPSRHPAGPLSISSQISRNPSVASASLLSPGTGMMMTDLPLHRTSSMHMMVTRPSDPGSRDRTPTSSIRAPSPQGAGQAYYYRGIPEV